MESMPHSDVLGKTNYKRKEIKMAVQQKSQSVLRRRK
jgi:hypothetical protein